MRLDMDLDDLVAALASRDPVAGSHQQPVQPGIEAVGIAHRPDVEPRREQRLLHGISRAITVSKDQPRGPMQSVDGTGGQPREGFVIARPRAQDQVSLHPRLMVGAATRPRSPTMGP